MATAREPRPSAAGAADLAAALDRLRQSHAADPYPALDVRRDRLRRLEGLLRCNGEAIAAAISADFGVRALEETELVERFTSLEGIAHARRRLRRWMRPERRRAAWWMGLGRARVIRQPLGVVGIIVPWNYPLYLAVSPLTAALAAGNRAMVKVSERTPRFGALFGTLVAESFRDDEVVVVNGDAEVGRAFAALPFDHLLFTGSTAVGREIMRAAAGNLTPVTLELGGKSPAIVAPGADLAECARRLMYGKLVNAGQTCVAPDYALVPAAQVGPFVAQCRDATRAMFPVLATSPQYTSLIDARHYERVAGLVADAAAHGATVHALHDDPDDRARRRMSPVALTGVRPDMRVMQEEVFGPVLPVVGYESIDEAIAFVNARPRPLALYYFGPGGNVRDAVLTRTVSGGVTVWHAGLHAVQEDLPFGGVGASGMGAYHGRAGFDAFSHAKPVLIDARLSTTRVLAPPYGRAFRALLRFLLR